MALFDVPKRANKDADKSIAKKSTTKVKTATSVRGGSSLLEKITGIKSLVERKLGKYRDDYIIIKEPEKLDEYISKCITAGVISIDTETTGLNPITDNIVGLCLYSPNCKSAYVPINHISYITGMLIENQMPIDVCRNQMQRIADSGIDVIMFNAKFDMRVIKNQLGVKLLCTWDCYLASRILNENETNKGLKKLHQKYVLDGEEDEFSFGELFSDIKFNQIPIDVGYIYAAHDAIVTYELYEYQKKYLPKEPDEDLRDDLKGLAWVFHNIEMPCVIAVADMEDTGVELDLDYADELAKKYNPILEQKKNDFYNACDLYKDEIAQYRKDNVNCKLDNPINIGSPTQIAILLYDIIKVDSVDKKKPRGTGEEILLKIGNPICQKILDYRGVEKLVNTYINKLPTCILDDNRIHCSFNQYGTDTGRFSSSEPNLQNIPSHNTDIRKMFKATDGYVMMSSDFSQQEPKCLAALCRKDGDSQMYDTFMQGKDLYSEIASKAFNKPYEECLEFRPDGTTNKDGKNRRSQAKSILLGVLYGRGVPSIAEQLGTSTKEAQSIKDSVFRGFPAIKKFESDSIDMAQTEGYITTVCGRKRRLPSMLLPDYEVKWKDGAPPTYDPLDFDTEPTDEVPYDVQKKWITRVKSVPFRDKRKVFEAANDEGLWIVDNTMDKDVTKVVNARIQGSAADLTKLAMIELYNNKELTDLGFRMLIQVHDEIIAECPKENAKKCSELLAKTMSYAAEQILEMPIKCDVTVTERWYGEELEL